MRFGLGDLDELPSLKEFEALAREALGADDGIAAEAESEAGEPASPDSPNAGAPPAAEVSGESPASAPAEDGPREVQSRADANTSADAGGETLGESDGRAAKQAAPGNSD